MLFVLEDTNSNVADSSADNRNGFGNATSPLRRGTEFLSAGGGGGGAEGRERNAATATATAACSTSPSHRTRQQQQQQQHPRDLIAPESKSLSPRQANSTN